MALEPGDFFFNKIYMTTLRLKELSCFTKNKINR